MKVAVLDGDPDIKQMIAISYYDSKPIYFLYIVVRNVEWIDLKRKCFVFILFQASVCSWELHTKGDLFTTQQGSIYVWPVEM